MVLQLVFFYKVISEVVVKNADPYELKQKLQQTRINAFKNYVKDVKDNKFPYKDVTVSANEDVVNALEKYTEIMKNRI